MQMKLERIVNRVLLILRDVGHPRSFFLKTSSGPKVFHFKYCDHLFISDITPEGIQTLLGAKII